RAGGERGAVAAHAGARLPHREPAVRALLRRAALARRHRVAGLPARRLAQARPPLPARRASDARLLRGQAHQAPGCLMREPTFDEETAVLGFFEAMEQGLARR